MKMIPITALCLCLGLLALAPVGEASPEVDLLFATPHFEAAPDDTVLTYRRSLMKAAGDEGILNERVDIELTLGSEPDGRRWSEVVIDPAGTPQRYDRFEGLSGNPMLMVFLEDVVKAVREGTGGSPHYLRNRVKEALAHGIERKDESAAETLLTLRPFINDARRAELGPFTALSIQFQMDRAAPGMLTRMEAEAGTAYREEITLVPAP